MQAIKRVVLLLFLLLIVFTLAACGGNKETQGTPPDPNQVTLTVYAPTTSLGVVSTAVNAYKRSAPQIDIQIIYDESLMLAAKVEAGYKCDIFIAEEPMQMDWLDVNCGEDENPNANDLLLEGSRTELFKGFIPDPEAEDGQTETVYTAAVIKTASYPIAAQTFIDFLRNADYEEAEETYKEYGFEKVE